MSNLHAHGNGAVKQVNYALNKYAREIGCTTRYEIQDLLKYYVQFAEPALNSLPQLYKDAYERFFWHTVRDRLLEASEIAGQNRQRGFSPRVDVEGDLRFIFRETTELINTSDATHSLTTPEILIFAPKGTIRIR